MNKMRATAQIFLSITPEVLIHKKQLTTLQTIIRMYKHKQTFL